MYAVPLLPGAIYTQQIIIAKYSYIKHRQEEVRCQGNRDLWDGCMAVGSGRASVQDELLVGMEETR
jgi:hypothetical protein